MSTQVKLLAVAAASLLWPALVMAADFCAPMRASGQGQPSLAVSGGDVRGLLHALRTAAPGTTLWLGNGTYKLGSNQSLEVNTPRITVRSALRKRDAVVIEGGYNNVSVNADDFTIADVTLRRPRYHNVQVRGEKGARRAKIYNVHLQDAGQQFVKISTGDGRGDKFADDGLVACSLFEYTTHAPGSYTNGVDILAGDRWVVRDNVFRRIRSKQGPAGPAVLVWKNSTGTVVRRNVIIDSWRGIALGLSAPDKLSRGGVSAIYDHQDGLVENNVFLALNEPADAAIENSYAANSRIFHNTAYYDPRIKHPVYWSIEYRFPPTTAIIKNNLTNRPILKRAPEPRADAVIAGNVTEAQPDWFRDISAGDFRLKAEARQAVDSGVPLPESESDIDGSPRPLGEASDVGAHESQSGRR